MVSVSGGNRMAGAMNALGGRLSNATQVRVGFLENSKYPDGTPTAMIAAIQNFGAPAKGIPPRPFFSNAIAKYGPEWPGQIAKLIEGGADAATALGTMGEIIKGEIVQSIQDTNTPPLKPATIKRKGFDKPLIDTSHMWKSVDSEVS